MEKKTSTKKPSAKAKKVASKGKKTATKKSTAKKTSAKAKTVVKRSPTSTKIYNTLNKLKVVDLKIMLEGRKLPKTGKKAELIERLMIHAKENPDYSPKKPSPKKVSPKRTSPKKASPKRVSPKKTAFLDMEFSEDREYGSGEESDSDDGLLYSSPGSKSPSFGSSEDWTGATLEDEDDDLEGADTEMGRKVERLHKIIPVYNFLKDMSEDELIERLSSHAGYGGVPELKKLKRLFYKNDLIGYLMLISGYDI